LISRLISLLSLLCIGLHSLVFTSGCQLLIGGGLLGFQVIREQLYQIDFIGSALLA
jgi:hypothetical protein